MAEAFIEKYRRFCGGSRILAALISVNLLLGVTLWVVTMIILLAHKSPDFLIYIFALPSDPSIFASYPWTLLTYMVTHFSPLHLIFNVLWLYWFGRLIILSSGDKDLLASYVGGGITGGIAYMVASISGASAGAYLCGASASVLAIMTVVALTMPNYEIKLFLFGRVKVKWFAIVCILFTLVGTSSGTTGVSLAHLGGILFGAAYGFFLRKRQSGKDFLPHIWNKGKKSVASFMKRHKPQRPKNAEAMVKAAKGKLCDHERLDELLDKIRLSGYNSLTDHERRELDALSARLRSSPK